MNDDIILHPKDLVLSIDIKNIINNHLIEIMLR